MTKLTTIFLVLLIAAGNNAFAQFSVNVNLIKPITTDNNDSIYYDIARKLTWDDFKAAPVLTGNVGAITSAGFGYRAGMRSVDGKAYLNLTVHCFFIKSRSWVKPNKKEPYVLNHEQHHYDIAYIAAGMFVRKLNETELTMKNYRKKIKEIYDDTYSFMYKLQDQYDNETKNGQDTDKQGVWDKKIDEMVLQVRK